MHNANHAGFRLTLHGIGMVRPTSSGLVEPEWNKPVEIPGISLGIDISSMVLRTSDFVICHVATQIQVKWYILTLEGW